MENTYYRAERAVILAAGRGERLRPLTDQMPKPMVRVGERRIIDTLLCAIRAAGISEIYIVRGYLGEKFEILREEYPEIKFIDNPLWHEANNVTSVLAAGRLVENAFIIEGDLFLQNPALLHPVQQTSNYLAIPVEETDDWCFFPDENGIIRRMSVGGRNCWKMVGISYWTPEDGRKLARSMQRLFDSPGGPARYWDEAALADDMDDFAIHVRPCREEDVQEIDTVAELEALRQLAMES
ncbi:phosphocholine cytidylyltransferase family protein [Selenomonas sputigena]|uniref:Phosphocholine cytidylyltransferase family protein n=1 Tax=Selenomonas sputigena TaxID=69823 RepID=A0ABV3X433_9FIRM